LHRVEAVLLVERDGGKSRAPDQFGHDRDAEPAPAGVNGFARAQPAGQGEALIGHRLFGMLRTGGGSLACPPPAATHPARARQRAALICATACSRNSSMVRRIWWSDCATPLASKSLRILRKTSWSPASSKSDSTTSLA